MAIFSARTCFTFATILLLIQTAPARAQGTRADYERARALPEMARQKVFGGKVDPHWFAEGKRFWYQRDLREGAREFIVVDATAGTRNAAFDHGRLAAALSKAASTAIPAEKLPIDQLEFSDDGKTLDFAALGKTWRCDLTEYALNAREPLKPATTAPATSRPARRAARPPATSPDGHWTAFLKDHNVYLRAVPPGQEFALSDDGTEADYYENDFYWSPDSKKLVARRTTRAQEHKVYIVQSSPPDQLQPKLVSYNYPKPGDKIAVAKPHLFDVEARKQITVLDSLFPNAWSIEHIRWDRDSRRFKFLYNQRGHQVLRVIAVNAASGEPQSIVDEQSKTFIDYAGKQFVHYLDDSDEILWMSERDGWNHLYLFDQKTGQIKNQITKGPWVVRGVERVDEAKRQIWFRAGGIHPAQDPYYIHYCRINFDGSGLVVLTQADGTHSASFSPISDS